MASTNTLLLVTLGLGIAGMSCRRTSDRPQQFEERGVEGRLAPGAQQPPDSEAPQAPGLQPGWMAEAAIFGRFDPEDFRPALFRLPDYQKILHRLIARALADSRSQRLNHHVLLAKGRTHASFSITVLESDVDLVSLESELVKSWTELPFIDMRERFPQPLRPPPERLDAETLAFLRKLARLGEHTRIFLPNDDPEAQVAEIRADYERVFHGPGPWASTCAALEGLAVCTGSEHGLVAVRRTDTGVLIDTFSPWLPYVGGPDFPEFAAIVEAGLARGMIEDDPALEDLRGPWAGLFAVDPLIEILRQRQLARAVAGRRRWREGEIDPPLDEVIADARTAADFAGVPSLFTAVRLELDFASDLGPDRIFAKLELRWVPRADAELERRFPVVEASWSSVPALAKLCDGAILCARLPPPSPARFADLARGPYADIPTWLAGPEFPLRVSIALAGHWPNLIGALAGVETTEGAWASVSRHVGGLAKGDLIGLRVEEIDPLWGVAAYSNWLAFAVGPASIRPELDALALDSGMQSRPAAPGIFAATRRHDLPEGPHRTHYQSIVVDDRTWAVVGDDPRRLQQLLQMPRGSDAGDFVLADVTELVAGLPSLAEHVDDALRRKLRIELGGAPGAPTLTVWFGGSGLKKAFGQ